MCVIATSNGGPLVHALTATRISTSGDRRQIPHQRLRAGRVIRGWTDHAERPDWVVFSSGGNLYWTRRIALLAALGRFPARAAAGAGEGGR